MITTITRIHAKLTSDIVRIKPTELIELMDLADSAFNGQACEHTTLYDLRESISTLLNETQRRTK